MSWKETEDNNRFGVYKIKCLGNEKVYIGSTCKTFLSRWEIHLRLLRQNKHHSIHLQNSFNKFGEDSLVFEILEILEEEKEFVVLREQYYIDIYKASHKEYGFNICPIAGSNRGSLRTEKTRAKIARAKIGNQNAKGSKRSLEFKIKVSNAIAKKNASTNYIKLMTESDRTLIAKLLETGEPVLKLSKLFGFSRGRIYNIKKEVDELKCRGSKIA